MKPWHSFLKSMTNLIISTPFKTRQVGAANSFEFRLFLEDAATGKVISPFHDVPLWVNKEKGIVNMVVEIPRWTNAKLEICKDELMNPIKQDVKKEKLRFVKNVFPHHGYLWNYGAIPQTWESPDLVDKATGCKGDNDPIDALEIGSEVISAGSVKAVKVLGVIGLIDEGETDWKLVVIDVNDPLAAKLNDITDVDTYCPDLLRLTHNWFRDYKVPDGKGKNEFAFNGEYKDRSFALSIVNETNEMWHKLINDQIPNSKDISLTNRQNENKYVISSEEESELPCRPASIPECCPIEPSVNKQYFIC